MHTFNHDAFLHKATADVGALAAKQPGGVNLVPGMPGMGLFASIVGACQTMEDQAGMKTTVISMDDLESRAVRLPAAAQQQWDSSQVIVIDAVGSHLAGERLELLVDTIKQARAHASVWVVGGDIDAVAQELGGEVSRFQVRAKARQVGKEAGNSPAPRTAGPKP